MAQKYSTEAYDPATKSFYDVFWVASIDKIYHMKSLCLLSESALWQNGRSYCTTSKWPKCTKKSRLLNTHSPEIHFDEEALKRSITAAQRSEPYPAYCSNTAL